MKMPRAANLAVEMVVFIRSSFVNEFSEAVGRMPEWIEIEKIISIPLHGVLQQKPSSATRIPEIFLRVGWGATKSGKINPFRLAHIIRFGNLLC
jgi:hypothetical protein